MDATRIVVTAVDQASSILQQIRQNVQQMADWAKKAVSGFTDAIEKNRAGLESIRNVSGIAFAGIAGTVWIATARFGEFEKQMSAAKATLWLLWNDTKTKQQFKELTDLAIELWAQSKFTAKEAAEGITVLWQAGFSTKEIMQSLKWVMDLAAASNIWIAESADIATSVLRQYNIPVSDTSRVMDVLAKTTVATNADMSDLRESFKYFGSDAKAFGISIEESASMIGILANQWIKWSVATQALSSSLYNLAAPTENQTKAITNMWLSAYDSQWRFVWLQSVLDQLTASMSSMTDEQKQANLAAIFGKNAVWQWQALLAEQTITLEDGTQKVVSWAEAYRFYTKMIKEAWWTTDQMARVQLDNMNWSLEQLSWSFDSLWITIWSLQSWPIKYLAEWLIPVVDSIKNWVKENPVLTQTIILIAWAVTWIVAVVSAIGLVIPSLVAWFATLWTIFTAVWLVFTTTAGLIWLAVAGIVIVVVALIAAIVYNRDYIKLYTRMTREVIMMALKYVRDGIISIITDAMIRLSWAWDSIVKAWNDFSTAFVQTFTSVWESISSTFMAIRDSIVLFFQNIWLSIQNAWYAFVEFFTIAFSAMRTGIKNTFTNIREWMKKTALSVLDFLSLFFTGEGRSKIAAWFTAMFSDVGGIMKGIVNNVIWWFEWMVNGAIEMVNKLIEAINSVNVASGLTGSIPSLWRVTLPRFANGWLVDSGVMRDYAQQFALGGMVSGPSGIDRVPAMLSPGELILNRSQQENLAWQLGSGWGQTIYITFQPQIFGSKEWLAEEMMDGFMKEFKKHTTFESW